MRAALIVGALAVFALGLVLLGWLLRLRRRTAPRSRGDSGPPPPPSALGKLVVCDGEEAGRTYFFSQPTVRIGRDRDHADLVLEDRFISNPHCSIVLTGGTFYLIDEASTNGTRLNGDVLPAHDRRPLMLDAMIEIGQTRLRFVPLKVSSEIGARLGTPYPPPDTVDREGRTVRGLSPGPVGTANQGEVALGDGVPLEAVPEEADSTYVTEVAADAAVSSDYGTRAILEDEAPAASYVTQVMDPEEEDAPPTSYTTRVLNAGTSEADTPSESRRARASGDEHGTPGDTAFATEVLAPADDEDARDDAVTGRMPLQSRDEDAL